MLECSKLATYSRRSAVHGCDNHLVALESPNTERLQVREIQPVNH